MLTFSDTFRDVNEFSLQILAGYYDRQIYSYLNKLRFEYGYKEFNTINPVEMFNWIVEYENPSELLYITPGDLSSCAKRRMDLSKQEIKIVILLAALVKDMHNLILEFYKVTNERSKAQ